MALGVANRQGNLLDDVERFCGEQLAKDSIYAFLHRERETLFPDEAFADLFDRRGRNSVPPSVVAVVMVLQRLEGLSDREAVERFCFDSRWRYAAGVGGYDTGNWTSFSHTVLVDFRERLRRSERPGRVFAVVLAAASNAGLVGRRRVLDSTPLYDAVATMDTITLIRSAIRSLLRAADADLEAELRSVLASGDDYTSSAKPQIDWDDAAARDELIDSRAKDGAAVVLALQKRTLAPAVFEAACLLVRVLGQDLDERDDGAFAIATRVAPDRVISTVDPDSRHGRKTVAHGFDGYKGHIALDPDSEIVTATSVSAGNLGDASVAEELITDVLEAAPQNDAEPAVIYGDNAYGTGPLQARLGEAGVESRLKCQTPAGVNGHFAKEAFAIDLAHKSVTCPAGVTVHIAPRRNGEGVAEFAGACTCCVLRSSCTSSSAGRAVRVGAYEAELTAARARQRREDWKADYRATRPKVERKLAHLMARRHGGRRARMRGRLRVAADFDVLAAAHNLARLAVLGAFSSPSGWATP